MVRTSLCFIVTWYRPLITIYLTGTEAIIELSQYLSSSLDKYEKMDTLQTPHITIANQSTPAPDVYSIEYTVFVTMYQDNNVHMKT